jgi:hypothetical protein
MYPGAVYAGYIRQCKESTIKHEIDVKSVKCIVSGKFVKGINSKREIVCDDDTDGGGVEEDDKPHIRHTNNAMTVVDFMHGVIPTRNLFKVFIFIHTR